MKYIDLYLQEIERHLPQKNRTDILKEIQSTLMDMIEDQNPNPSQPVSDEIVKAVLTEFGSPRKVARQFNQHGYLIGPSLFPTYLQVLRIVLIVVAALNLLGLIVSIVSQSNTSPGMIETFAQIVGGLFSSLFTAFGIVTLSFAGIERTTPDTWKVKIDEDWKPDDLLKVEDRKSVKIAELAVEITFTLIFIALINFFLDKIGIYYLGDAGWVSAPIINENFLRYVPWITASNVLSIALNLYLIQKGYWNKTAVIGKLMINAFTVAVSIAILIGPAIITVTETAWQALNFDIAATAQQVTNSMNIAVDVLIGLSIFGVAVDSIKQLYQAFIKGSHTKIELEV